MLVSTACSEGSGEPMIASTEVCETERSPDRVREQLLGRCRQEQVEPPTDGRIDRMVRSALHQGEATLSSRIAARLPASTAAHGWRSWSRSMWKSRTARQRMSRCWRW